MGSSGYQHGAEMTARLGNVLYWIGCIAAVLLTVGGVLAAMVMLNDHPNEPIPAAAVAGALAVCALISWGIGRACRYVLSGN